MCILTILQNLIKSELDSDSIIIREDMSIDEIEGWDSLTHLNIITMCEDKFKIRFTIDEIISLKYFKDWVTTIEKKIK